MRSARYIEVLNTKYTHFSVSLNDSSNEKSILKGLTNHHEITHNALVNILKTNQNTLTKSLCLIIKITDGVSAKIFTDIFRKLLYIYYIYCYYWYKPPLNY